MISYNNSDVIQCLRQYEMFANSLNLVKNQEQREMIIKQLTKLEEKILMLTNEIYVEEAYNLGRQIVKMNLKLDFGLSNSGIMGAVARGVVDGWNKIHENNESKRILEWMKTLYDIARKGDF